MKIELCSNQIDFSECVQITEDNLGEVAKWCGGQVKGIRLPRSERVIDFYNAINGGEERAEVGDLIVRVVLVNKLVYFRAYTSIDFYNHYKIMIL